MSALSEADGAEDTDIQRLHLTLRCRNVKFAGVRTEREQAKLREYSLKE
jgi:hypothetical protein